MCFCFEFSFFARAHMQVILLFMWLFIFSGITSISRKEQIFSMFSLYCIPLYYVLIIQIAFDFEFSVSHLNDNVLFLPISNQVPDLLNRCPTSINISLPGVVGVAFQFIGLVCVIVYICQSILYDK